MKKLILCATLLSLCISCKKDDTPIVKGGTYRLKSGHITPGTWGPLDTMYALRIYLNPASGVETCSCKGPQQGRRIIWDAVKQDTVTLPPATGDINFQMPIDWLKK